MALTPALGAGAVSPRTTAPARITLTAVAENADGRVLRRSVRLDTLERADVRVLSRTASSVTVAQVGAGKSGPRATFRVRIVAGTTDALAHVRSVVPEFGQEGTTTSLETQPSKEVVSSAYRRGTGRQSATASRFAVNDVSAAQLRDQYFALGNGLVELRVTGYTAVGTNSFRQVPGLVNTVRSFSGGTPR